MEELDLEPFRARSNTWPLPRPDESAYGHASPSSEENDVSDASHLSSLLSANHANHHLLLPPCASPASASPTLIPTTAHELTALPKGQAQQQQQLKKNTSRRNAWGNMSYADLITQAIQGSPDKRLTLSQIYEWMVQNVPYFKDKGDSNSSAGWKVRQLRQRRARTRHSRATARYTLRLLLLHNSRSPCPITSARRRRRPTPPPSLADVQGKGGKRQAKGSQEKEREGE